jgi:hypothetical protein
MWGAADGRPDFEKQQPVVLNPGPGAFRFLFCMALVESMMRDDFTVPIQS